MYKRLAFTLTLIIICFIATGCIIKKPITGEAFKKQFAALGYEVIEDQDANYRSNKFMKATKEDVPFEVLFYEFDSEIDSKKTYEKYKSNIINYVTSNTTNTETTSAVFSKMVVESQKEYIIISRIKNTLVFVNSSIDFKDEVLSVIKNIHY